MSIALEDVLAGRVDLTDVVDVGAAILPLVTPGEILLEEFMRPLGLSSRRLADALGVPVNRVSQIIKGQRAITAGTALRLARYFETSPGFWLNLQQHHELQRALAAEGEAIHRQVQPRNKAA
jgi:addiction module HigA family antidote